MLAPAKINLDLRILGRRPDGYHALDSRVVFTALGDRLRLTGEAGGLLVDGPHAGALESGGGNLVLKAAHALADAAARPLDAGFHLTKTLPVAAGVGGGSSDAAAALRLLAARWGWRGDLVPLAASIGADVPVCLRPQAARMTGIGEIVTPLEQGERARLAGTPILLVNPRVALPTGSVFAALASGAAKAPDLDGVVLTRNDLLAAAIRVRPVIAEVIAALAQGGRASLLGMSGSGPTCFALFDGTAACVSEAARLTVSHPRWWVAPTRLI